MLNKVKALTVLILFSAAALVSADGYKPKAPKKGHVLVVGSVSYKKPIDIEARREGFGANKNLQIGKTYEFSLIPNFAHSNTAIASEGVDGYFYQEIKVPKDGKLYLNHIDVTLFGNVNMWYKFRLPGGVFISVPDEAVYVYIGNFEYDLDYALRTVGFHHLDDYEATKKYLSREIGTDIDLYRAALDFDSKN